MGTSVSPWQRSLRWTRNAAESGQTPACLKLAACVYADRLYAREVGHVGEAAGVAASAWAPEGHNVPPEVLTDVLHWLRKGCRQGLELVHFSAQLERIAWDRGCAQGLCNPC